MQKESKVNKLFCLFTENPRTKNTRSMFYNERFITDTTLFLVISNQHILLYFEGLTDTGPWFLHTEREIYHFYAWI